MNQSQMISPINILETTQPNSPPVAEKVSPLNDIDFAVQLHNRSISYYAQGQHQKAEALGLEALTKG